MHRHRLVAAALLAGTVVAELLAIATVVRVPLPPLPGAVPVDYARSCRERGLRLIRIAMDRTPPAPALPRSLSADVPIYAAALRALLALGDGPEAEVAVVRELALSSRTRPIDPDDLCRLAALPRLARADTISAFILANRSPMPVAGAFIPVPLQATLRLVGEPLLRDPLEAMPPTLVFSAPGVSGSGREALLEVREVVGTSAAVFHIVLRRRDAEWSVSRLDVVGWTS